MTTKSAMSAWAADNEHFEHESLHDLLSTDSELSVGDIVYVGNVVPPKIDHLIDVDDIFSTMSSRAWEIGGEYADDYPNVTPEAKAELEAFLYEWVAKHAAPTFYTVENVQKYVLTAEDLGEA